MNETKAPLVVVILTKDEEVNVGKAIASVGGRAPVLVLDSGSSDDTVGIAHALGAEVHERPFTDYSTQRNHALDLVKDRFTWVFFLDADEELTPTLWKEIEGCLARDDLDGAYVGYTFHVLGHELRRGGFGGASVLRLMRTARARFRRGINERVDDRQLRTTRLAAKLRHDDHKPLASWFQKHVRYAQREAAEYLSRRDRDPLEGFSWRTKAGRTVGIRWAYDRLPIFARPFAHCARTICIQHAWRDGLPGVMYAAMQSLWYPMLIDLFIYEARRTAPRNAP